MMYLIQMCIIMCLETQPNVFPGKKLKIGKPKKCTLPRAFKHLQVHDIEEQTSEHGLAKEIIANIDPKIKK